MWEKAEVREIDRGENLELFLTLTQKRRFMEE